MNTNRFNISALKPLTTDGELSDWLARRINITSGFRIFSFQLIAAIVFLTFNFHVVHAQVSPSGMSVTFKTKPKIFFQFDTYRSFVSDRGASTFGFKAGLEFNSRIKFGIGYNTLTSDIVKDKEVVFTRLVAQTELTIDTILPARLTMKFVPLLFEYIFYNEDPWQISVPLNIGLGKSYWWYFKYPSIEKGQTEKKTVLLMTMNVDAQYKVVRWVGVGAGLGFRKMLVDNNIGENLNSVIYSVQVRFFLDEIYKSLFPKKNQKE